MKLLHIYIIYYILSLSGLTNMPCKILVPVEDAKIIKKYYDYETYIEFEIFCCMSLPNDLVLILLVI